MQISLNEKEKICIGIPCFHGVTYEVLDDYMRLAYHLGRRNQEYEFYLAIKGKGEQYRARNAIVEQAIATACDYLFMLDDDHIFDIDKTLGPSECYNIIAKLVQHLKEDSKKGIVGALYYQRGATCDPVIMYRNHPGYTFYNQADISRRLQKVDVTGGGAMCINMKVFDKIESPWFVLESEKGQGTDIQICEKVADAGWEVWCDTSLEIGHIMAEREIVSSKNAQDIRVEASQWMNREDIKNAPALRTSLYIHDYEKDVLEYSQKTIEQLEAMAKEYVEHYKQHFDVNNLKSYYSTIGIPQLARNFLFHKRPEMVQLGAFVLSVFNPQVTAYGLDFGCGSAPIGFELAMRGQKVDFVDIPGSAANDFVQWRAKKHKMSHCGFTLGMGYDWVLLLDVLEHLHPEETEKVMSDLVSRLKPSGSIVTNYWYNSDYANVEHINMNQDAVKEIFLKLGMEMLPFTKGGQIIKDFRWVKGGT